MAEDIISVYNKILKSFDNESIIELSKKKEYLESVEPSERITSSLNQVIRCIEEAQDKKAYYILKVSPLINRYKEILNTPIKLGFTNGEVVGDKNKALLDEKSDIINQFITSSQDYTTISFPQSSKKDDSDVTCPICNSSVTTCVIDCEEVQTCSKCGYQEELDPIFSSYLDVNRINVSSKYTYDRTIHFVETINNVQGKQKNVIIPQDVIDKLEIEFEKQHLLDPDPVKRYSRITKNHIYIFLKVTHYNIYYDNANLIYYMITGKPLMDFSHLEDKLIEDFKIFCIEYEKLQIQKKHFNYQNILYQLLCKNRFPCSPSDFNILKTPDRQMMHNDVIKKIFEPLGWNYTPFF